MFRSRSLGNPSKQWESGEHVCIDGSESSFPQWWGCDSSAPTSSQPETRCKPKCFDSTGHTLQLRQFLALSCFLRAQAGSSAPSRRCVRWMMCRHFHGWPRSHFPARVTCLLEASDSCIFLHSSIPLGRCKTPAWCFPADSVNYWN